MSQYVNGWYRIVDDDGNVVHDDLFGLLDIAQAFGCRMKKVERAIKRNEKINGLNIVWYEAPVGNEVYVDSPVIMPKGVIR